MVRNDDLVAIFHSIHRVMKAEKLLKQARVDILLIPVPRRLSSDCGLAIRYPATLREEVAAMLEGEKLLPEELYLFQDGAFHRQSP